MSSSNRPWPPLIVARHVSRIIKWRDILLTLMMWGFFAVLLDTEFELFLGNYLEQLGLGPFDTNANWPVFFARLMPFLLTAAILAGLLIIFGLRTLRRRSRALFLPQPAPLETADQAHRAGLDEAELIVARDQRIVVVHIDTNGSHRIEAPHGQ
jgi:poly-beta-1,6-N-acetyl-D-glucosamine biosynthesis protein PgaD